jgi:hypothetical protein
VLHPLNHLWTLLGLALHQVVTPIVMGVLFYGIFTPMAALIRLGGKDLLRLRWDLAARTYWIERQPHGPPPETLQRQF